MGEEMIADVGVYIAPSTTIDEVNSWSLKLSGFGGGDPAGSARAFD